MSDAPQGSGWWKASDGRWYPPQPPPYCGTVAPSPHDPSKSDPPTAGVWWRHPAAVVASLVLCFPVGLVLVWRTSWSNRTKGIVSVAVLAVVAYAGWSDDGRRVGQVAAVDESAAVRETTTTREFERTTTSTTTTVPPTTQPPDVVVDEVVDGDTIRVEGGTRVRLIGIDAPDSGDFGFAEAREVLSSLVIGKRVVLVPGARDDMDRYGRLLRYVDVDGVDVNLKLLESGWVRARYDSRDGYGRHTREDAYVAADAATSNRFEPPPTTAAPPPPEPRPFAPSPPPTAAAPPPPPAGGGTDPRFDTCKDAIAAGFGNYRRGIDPEYDWYRDADSDGIVCE